MDKKALFLILIAFITSLVVVYALEFAISARRVVDSAAGIYTSALTEKTELLQQAIRQDVLSGNLNGARATLEIYRERQFLVGYELLDSKGQVLAQSAGPTDSILIRKPILFARDGEPWGSVNLRYSSAGLGQIRDTLNTNLFRSTVFTAIFLLSLVILFLRFMSSLTDELKEILSRFSFGLPLMANNRSSKLWKPTIDVLEVALHKRETLEKNFLQVEKEAALAGVAQQVAHDIRSPVSAIGMVIKSVENIPEDKKAVIRNAALRINQIADDLLSKHKTAGHSASHSENSTARMPADLIAIASSVFAEKAASLAQTRSISMRLDIPDKATALAHVSEADLSRALSNLMNNSIEALAENGTLTLAVRIGSKNTSIIVSDNGKGIPEEVLAKLGKEKISHEKSSSGSGSGIGVFSAQKTVERSNGRMSIQSKVGLGTIVTLTFPNLN